MEPYRNLGGNSNVQAYVNGDGFIIVQFMSGTDTYYKYTSASAGGSAIAQMQSLAIQGQGLNSYISTNKPSFAAKGSSLASVQ